MTAGIGQIDWPAASWLQKQGRVLLAWAVFNPHGPTLRSVGFVDNGEDRHVFLCSLGPGRQAAFSLGTVNPADVRQAEQISDRVRAGLTAANEVPADFAPLPCIPSLVSLSSGPSARTAATAWLHAALASHPFDWGREFYYLDKYGDGLFARAAEEAREALEQWRRTQPDSDATRQVVDMAHARFGHMQPFADWQPPEWPRLAFDESVFQRWLGTLTAERFYSRGFHQFAQAWIAASRQRAEAGAALNAVGFDELLAFLRHYRHPIWPADWSEETVAGQMNAGGGRQHV